MTEDSFEIVVDTVKDQLAKTVIGAIAGFAAAKLTDKAYDKIITIIRSR